MSGSRRWRVRSDTRRSGASPGAPTQPRRARRGVPARRPASGWRRLARRRRAPRLRSTPHRRPPHLAEPLPEEEVGENAIIGGPQPTIRAATVAPVSARSPRARRPSGGLQDRRRRPSSWRQNLGRRYLRSSYGSCYGVGPRQTSTTATANESCKHSPSSCSRRVSSSLCHRHLFTDQRLAACLVKVVRCTRLKAGSHSR